MSDIDALRADLVRAARAHGRRAELAVRELPDDREAEVPPWLYDAWRGSSMAALYGEVLAAVLGHENCDDELVAYARMLLENGPEDENEDLGVEP